MCRPWRTNGAAPLALGAVLGALLGLAAPAPQAVADRRPGPYAGPQSSAGRATTEVYRLAEEAGRATARYERDRRAARAERVRAERLDDRLRRKRRALAALHAEAGGIARRQYRAGGGLPSVALLLGSRSPEQAVRHHQAVRLRGLALTRTLEAAHRASRELATAEHRAAAAWRELRGRTRHLARVKRGAEQRLALARGRLQQQADRAARRGRCGRPVRATVRSGARAAGAARRQGRRWTRPVEDYALSASFASAGVRWARRHTGQDFAVPIGTPVRSVGPGRVVAVECGGGYGMSVLVRHPGGFHTQYAHLAVLLVRPGEPVRTGLPVALSGDTGNSTGPHLHFEVRTTSRPGSAVDPVRWLGKRGVRL